MPETLFRPGENCAQVAHADRVAFVIDAENYFRVFMQAAQLAQRSIVMLGWDFDSRTPLALDAAGKPILFGEFMNGLVRDNRDLRVHILDWDFPAALGTDREPAPGSKDAWKPHRHIDFRYDDAHPAAGSHHQRIVVIDERIAFAGGLDIAGQRWDTRKHAPDDPRLVLEEKPHPPFHGAAIAVDGAAAQALLRVARDRWSAATGEALKTAHGAKDVWPRELEVDITDVDVAISRTAPPSDKDAGISHVCELYVDMIERATDSIYMENQYFTSYKIGDALKKSLARPEGPEIRVVTPLLSRGWLEELAITTLRAKLVRELREADVHKRFQVSYPDVPGLAEGACLDVHSNVTIVDDEWLRIGSATLSNRSMGMDTECDVTLEAKGEERVRKAIRRCRSDLLAESGLGSKARSLKKLECEEIPEARIVIAEASDPAQPLFEAIVFSAPAAGLASRSGFMTRRVIYVMGCLVATAIALALVWTHTPLKDLVTRENAAALADWFADFWWAPALIVLAYTPASFIMFPRWLITMTAVLAFGPWQGFACAMSGIILAGIVTFLPGRLVARGTVKRLAGPRMKPLARFMERKGVIAVTLVRLVPIAPFPVVNLVMGAMRVKLWHFALGTFLGMLPGTLAATVLSDQLAAALEDSTRVNFWMIAGAVAAIVALAFFGQRYMRRLSAH
jgi:uncharacterized membrane protein YdjX (TVP38/TMEM64 family)/phosphatidylserine/phosphatidylglycerophosphate/cardiolipin synthase-like enzyme